MVQYECSFTDLVEFYKNKNKRKQINKQFVFLLVMNNVNIIFLQISQQTEEENAKSTNTAQGMCIECNL